MARGTGLPFRVSFAAGPVGGDTQEQKYLRALEKIGLPRLADNPHLMMHSDPMVSRHAPEPERLDLFERHKEYWVKICANAHDKKAALERAAEHFGIYIDVRIGYTASETEAAIDELLR